jgi:very-short-patch-repair endonuclease
VGCPLCGIKKRNECKKLTTEEFIKRAIKIHGFLYNYSKTEYENYNTPLCIICSNHKKPYEFWQTPHSHLNGKGCPLCNGTKKLTREEFIKRAREIHGDKYDYSKVVYKNNFTKVCIIYNNHGKPYEFWQTPKDHLHGHGCFRYESSKGELKIVEFLTKNNINFDEQKTFEKCKYKNKLRFDFYLPSYNLCIEFDGIQHFVPTDFTSKSTNEEIMKNFKLNQLRDQIKNEYCEKNGINLLRIRYDENIEEKLTEYFQKHGIIKEQTLFETVS